MKTNMKARCSINPKHKEFEVIAHVTQSWKVDEEGSYLETINEAIEVTHNPDRNDLWSCITCGAEAIVE